MPYAPEPKFTDPNLPINQPRSNPSQQLSHRPQSDRKHIEPKLVSNSIPEVLKLEDSTDNEYQQNSDHPSETIKTGDTALSESVINDNLSVDSKNESTLFSSQHNDSEQASDLNLRFLFFNWVFGIIVLFLLGDAFVSLSIFQLKTLEVEGLEQVSSQELNVKIELDQLHPLIINPKLNDIEERVLSHPWIKEAQASLTWQGHIRLEVTEHKAKAIAVLDELKVVNADGQPFASILPSEIQDLPLISGLPPEIFNRSKKEELIGQYWLSQGIKLAQQIKSIGLDKQRKLSDIHISETGRYEIMLDKIRISLGLDMLKERLIEVEKILNQLDSKGVTAAYILLSDDLNRAIVKEIPITADDTESLK